MTMEQTRRRRFACTIFLLWISLLFSFPVFAEASATAAAKDAPFYPGERLTYELRWEFIRAGNAVLEIQPIKQVNGVPVYHFVLTAKSRSFIDNFYKVRDKIEAYAPLDMSRSVYYKKQQLEGKTSRDIEVTFDWSNKEAHYSNFGNKRDPVPLLPGTFDPLSAFYFSRGLEFVENTEIEAPVTDGKKCVVGKAMI